MGCGKCCATFIKVITCILALICLAVSIYEIVRLCQHDEKHLLWSPIIKGCIMVFIVVAICLKSKCCYILALTAIGIICLFSAVIIGLVFYQKLQNERESFKDVMGHYSVIACLVYFGLNVILFTMVCVSCKSDDGSAEEGGEEAPHTRSGGGEGETHHTQQSSQKSV